MSRLGLRVNGANNVEELRQNIKKENIEAAGTLEKSFGETTVDWDTMEKSFKYLRRWMGKNGKWQYLYADDLLHPVKAVKRLFGLEEQKVTDDYKANNIKKEYDIDKKTFVNHVLEYLSNRLKWDKIFSDKDNRAKYDKPVKQKDVIAAAAVEKLNDDGTPSLFQEKTPKTNIVNRSLMKKVWEIYNPQKNLDITPENTENKVEGEKNGKDQSSIGSGELPVDSPAIRDGGGEGASNLNVPSPGQADNTGESGGAADESGGSPGRNFRGRRGRSAIKEIREQVKKLLSEKKDDEFTEADKALLRQYEGGGGLAEKEATTHGTLYEFYTPQKVVDKVWQLVDKYNSRIDKTVIEPSAGTGRFADNRFEKFDLFELDETSARIARILHPDANVKQGYFQELFMNGRTPKKVYDGKKYDVAIGNPPYGDYSGLHRGLGEGKEHSRIEEYFIDRAIDTLKDGGILAMVVPSSFLRGKNSKAKQALAKKARLLEAWRLPNGTFGTTGVGTDIIVLRKEHGDLADFQNDVYFQKNEGNIVGVESEKLGRFGMEKYVAPPDGMGFDEAIDSIDPRKVPAVQVGEVSPAVQAAADVTVSAADEHKNRSEAMMGNDNAYKGGPADYFDDLKKWEGKSEPEATHARAPLITRTMKRCQEGATAKDVWDEYSLHYGDRIAADICQDYLYEVRRSKPGDHDYAFIQELASVMDVALKKIKIAEYKVSIKNAKTANAELKPGGSLQRKHLETIKLQEKKLSELENELKTIQGNDGEFQEGEKVKLLLPGGRKKVVTIKEITPAGVTVFDVFSSSTVPITEIEKMGSANEHGNRSQAMMGNDNAAGERGGAKEEPKGKKNSTDDYTRSIGKNMTANEFNEKYGISVDKGDIPIWNATDYAGRIDVTKLSKKDREHMMTSGNFTVDHTGAWYSNVNFASGNIYEKLDELKALDDGEKITGYHDLETYNKNKALLEAALPPPKAAENIKFSPISDFVKEYKIKDAESAALTDLRKAFEDWAKVHEWGHGRRASKNWNSDMSPISQYEIPPIINFYDVLNYIWQIPQKTDKATAKELDSDTARMEAAKKREARRECAERLFNRFIQEGLSEDKRKDLVEAWNRRFNSYVKPDYKKIPVIVNGMNTHKGKKKFDMKIEQVETVSFMCNKGNGISAANVGVGKALANYERVLTPTGWVENGSLKAGDLVIAADGTPAKILNIYPQGKQGIYRVTFHDGSTVDCTKEHLWAVRYPWARNKRLNPEGKDGIEVKELQEILPEIKDSRGQYKFSIPMCKPVQFEKKELPIAPYLFGILIGDGCFSHGIPTVTIPDEYIKDKISALLPEKAELRYSEKYDYRIVTTEPKKTNGNGQFELTNPVKIALMDMGLWDCHSWDKFIPDCYKYNSVEDRIELLRGLMDSDGYVDKRGLTPLYYTTSEKLAFDVGEIVQSLGGTVSTNSKIGSYKTKDGKKKECRVCYAVSMRLKGINPFSLPRKADRVKERTKYVPVRFIDNITYIGDDEAQCIYIDHPSHLYITDSYVVTHNTVIGEAVAVNRIQTGKAKRVLNVVPKAVYRKWIKEYHQHFPDAVINELQNFGKEHIARFMKGETGLNIPEGTISVCTMEALQKVTFKDETLNTELIDDMMDSQTIYDAETQEKRSPKERAEERESMMKRLGKGAKAKEGYLYWEDCGFDCLIIDEIHNFKNVFGQTRSFSASNKDTESKDRQSNEFKGLTGGESDRAMKLFAITQLVQKQNNGQNVFGLSATPFTNSPIEVYNMLSLVARNKLKELHIYNMYEFLAQFAEIKSEWSVGTKGDVVEKEVMKNWKNLGALQNLINEYMLYVDADEAGVIRPRLKPHAPQLELTPLQRAIIEAETDYMTNADPKKDPGATLKAINYMRMATLSPASINRERLEFYQSAYPDKFKGLKMPKSEDFVKSSPKMTFVCDSVAKAYKKLPDAGQIIYLPRGVNDFVHVKQYLMDQGMPEDSIAFMHSKTTLDEKERIKEEFNDPNGRVKVIIGSETIKEGVSLNGNTHSIYNCMLGWNPTEAIQVTGRAHRQGNKQGHVHVIYPLMADSIDSLMYQKHDEKSARINEIWSYKGDTSADVSDINPETLKFDLIKDPAKKANFIVGQKRDKVRADRRIEEARYEVLYKDMRTFERAEDVLPECKRDMDAAESEMLKKREARDKAKNHVDDLEKKKADQYTVMTAKRALDKAKWELEQATSVYRTEKKVWKEYNDIYETYRNKFRKMGIRPGKEDEKLKEISASIQKLKDQEESIENSYAFELEKAKKELEAQRKKIPPISSMVDENVSSIMGDLRPMDEVEKEIKAEMEAKGIKKSLVILNNRLFFKVS